MKIAYIKYLHPRSIVKFFSFGFYLAVIVILPNNVFGESLGRMSMSPKILPEEFKTLPKWCEVKYWGGAIRDGVAGLSDKEVNHIKHEFAKWAKVVGEDIFAYVHHQCFGMNWVNRYKRSFMFPPYKNVENDRKRSLENALAEFRFMRGPLRPKHKLYYSMLMNEAYIYEELKHINKAVKNYKEIIKRKPHYAAAYVKYAKLLYSNGKHGDAKKVLQMGLKKTKGAKIIKQAMSAMGR